MEYVPYGEYYYLSSSKYQQAQYSRVLWYNFYYTSSHYEYIFEYINGIASVGICTQTFLSPNAKNNFMRIEQVNVVSNIYIYMFHLNYFCERWSACRENSVAKEKSITDGCCFRTWNGKSLSLTCSNILPIIGSFYEKWFKEYNFTRDYWLNWNSEWKGSWTPNICIDYIVHSN